MKTCPGGTTDPKGKDRAADCDTRTGSWTCPDKWDLKYDKKSNTYYCKD